MTWIVEWSNLSEYEFGVTTWTSEDEALKHACSEIVQHISSTSADEDDDFINTAIIINDLIKSKEYRKAINQWNDCQSNIDNESMYWNVIYHSPKRYYGDVPNLDDYLTSLDEEETSPSIIVDDHTCTLCGNNKCSKQESSCWKCGHPIS